MLTDLLKEYELPELPEQDIRKKCLDIIQQYEFGYIPPAPLTVEWEITDAGDINFAGGKTTPTTVRIFEKTAEGNEYSFPVRVCIPNESKKYPFFIHLNFRPNIPDKYQPTEEIIDNGFAVITLCYEEVTSDNDDFTNGTAKAFYHDGVRNVGTQAGKIALWAWAAMRVMDYAVLALSDKLNFDKCAITGHSRLGKAALLTSAYDDRFIFTFSNCAGCAGDALEHNKTVTQGAADKCGETIADITKRFPYWFCRNYFEYANNVNSISRYN